MLGHVIYKCDYHIVCGPKYRFRILKVVFKELVESDIQMFCEWDSCEILGRNVQENHVHLVVSVSSKVSISELMGKIAIKLFKNYPELKKQPY